MIRIQTADFSVQAEYDRLAQAPNSGAISIFVGRVRDFNHNGANDINSGSFLLEHYPGMTENVLSEIKEEAMHRWPLNDVSIIHRVGQLAVDDQIVFVGASSPHREAAFGACQFSIDILKTKAPFWKKEGEHWVDMNERDIDKAAHWLE